MKTMRPTRLTTKFCVSAALGLALAGLLAIPVPARAEDDSVPLDTQIWRNIMSGLGLKSQDEADIRYEERPPLVLPSDHSLPAPGKADATVNDPAWPKDPDVARAKIVKELRNAGTTTDQLERESYPLRPDEMTPGRKYAPRMRQHRTIENPSIGADGTDRLKPSELGYNGGLFELMFSRKDEDKASAHFTGEPPRVSLTEPPPGYQTPSPNQPYGTGKAAPPKPENSYVTRGEYNKDQN
jgi:hypothetical protein